MSDSKRMLHGDCFSCGNLISNRWITEMMHMVECRDGCRVERREFMPHDKCWCPRWRPQESK